MRTARFFFFAAAAALALVAAPAARAAPETEAARLTVRNFRKMQAYIAPRPEELLWERIPWRVSFGAALEEGRRAERPVLLFTMDGHPLGET